MKLNQTDEVILVINAGSSSIKFSLFLSSLTLIYRGEIESIFDVPQITVSNAKQVQIVKKSILSSGYESALSYLFEWIAQLPTHYILKAVGHRVVHGGNFFDHPVLINADSIEKLSSLNPLAPLHQPHNVAIIKSILKLYPEMLQIACFDTSFHRTQDKLATLFAIPRELSEEGIVRYGFHGISYEYIASVLPEEIKNKKVIVAHLGNGASMCAMEYGKSVTTSMGFTALDGLIMGTRCGGIDPGVILYLLQEKKLSVEEVNTILYKKSGLLGVSGISSDMRELQSSTETKAAEAIDLFCYRAARELCALASSLQGCDAIIFTAGIGEHSALVRKKIGERLSWLGVLLDEHANQQNAAVISHTQSRVFVGVIPTNEEYMIAKHTLKVVSLD
ncbi:Acetate kinase (Acetokinase) [Legionella cherrii]|uniref:Acetate kinase n=1 Tax=Legionella cherrii TaxID=28084 RepID=A0A0W0S9E4_9GAMM|nr:acetate/propionate family kinase [Legionella cherrii]KTC79525.1 Acetate kinase (Acetokinase) [Legionella cherrii]